MVRSRAAGLAAALPHDAPDYFDSLKALEAHFTSPRSPRNRHAPPPVPLAARTAREQARPEGGKILVCHDYKGGYVEDDFERGYTLQHWSLVDTFVYFSHHRISCPPPGWIRAAHVNGAKILGVIIFEWNEGRQDIVELVSPSSSSPSSPFSDSSGSSDLPFKRLSIRYADYLVALAVEHGFEGWLVNVEVDLGLGEEKKIAKEHAASLLAWLKYLREEMHRKVPGAEVMWYDAVTIEGKLSWQNRVNDLNFPFFEAVDSFFLNYWWRQPDLKATHEFLRSKHGKKAEDIYFGLDVFGRGSYGGGRFESWRALQAIQSGVPSSFPSSAPPSSYASASSSFSTAIFAPGWTVEAETLSHSLTTPSSYARWLADDTYLWSHGQPTPSVATDAARTAIERKEQRGVQRARQLAAATAPSASPLPVAHRTLPPFSYDAPLDPLPGTGRPRPFSAFLPSPRPVPCPTSHFYTNFSTGSSHAFFIDGEKALDDSGGNGWTDAGFVFPQPSLLFHPSLADEREKSGVTARMTEEDAWEGPRALQLAVQSAKDEPSSERKDVVVPLCPVELPLPPCGAAQLDVTVVYKSTSVERVSLRPLLQAAPSFEGIVAVSQPQSPRLNIHNDWTSTTIPVTLRITYTSSPQPIALFHLALAVPPGSSVLVGALSISPALTPSSPTPFLTNLVYSPTDQFLRWDVDLLVPPLSSSPPYSSPSSRFSHFHVFLSRSFGTAGAPVQKEEVYLGTTFATEFALARSRLKRKKEGETVELVVRGVLGSSPARSGDEGRTARLAIDL
ncbi:hypothetical protein JCM8547_001624 [Rhodosporidiobolus lusitaniae]